MPRRRRKRREQVAALRQALAGVQGAEELLTDADALVEKSVWLIGGDGWAYDIGFGGLDRAEPDGKRQHSGAGYPVLLQHWRPGVKSHPAGRSLSLASTVNARHAKILASA
jgi:hypothetical protein